MKIKHARSQRALAKTLDKYFTDAKSYDYDSSYIPMSQKGFMYGLYENVWEVAVHVMISSYNVQNIKGDYLYTLNVNEDMLFWRFNLTSTKSTHQRKLISEAIESLENKGIIQRVWLDKGNEKRSKRSAFIVKQNIKSEDGKHRLFLSIQNKEFLKIILSDKTDNDKINLLSHYASLSTRMNKYSNSKKTGEPTTRTLIELMNPLNLQSQFNIAESLGITPKTTKKYIDMLCELKVISKIKVRKKSKVLMVKPNGEHFHGHIWTYYYSKYHERMLLKEFVSTLLLHTQFPDNSGEEYSDLSWANIDDVWDDEVHKEDN